jgi:hypothetical protein
MILVAVVFLGGNFYGYKWLATKQTALRQNVTNLQTEKTEAEDALKETDTWKQRMAWLNDRQPPLGEEGDAKASVLDFVVKGAKTNKLDIVEQSLNDVQKTPAGTRVNVSIKVKGSMQDLAKWLTSFEKPDDFYAVSLFSLKADTDLKSYDCTLQIARYFKGGP